MFVTFKNGPLMFSRRDLLFHSILDILTQDILLQGRKSIISSVLTPSLAPCRIFYSFLLAESI
jgi:hypothetical protein